MLPYKQITMSFLFLFFPSSSPADRWERFCTNGGQVDCFVCGVIQLTDQYAEEEFFCDEREVSVGIESKNEL